MNSNCSYSPETVKLVVDLCDLDLWPLTLTFCMDVTFVIGNNVIGKFHDDTMMGTWWKRCDRRKTDRQTDWTSHIAAWSQLKIIVFEYRQTSNISCTLDNKLVNHSHVVIILQQTLNFFYNHSLWPPNVASGDLTNQNETESWFP